MQRTNAELLKEGLKYFINDLWEQAMVQFQTVPPHANSVGQEGHTHLPHYSHKQSRGQQHD